MKMGRIRIISRSDERFRDREEAGRLLSLELGEFRRANPVVLGVPRGGVVVARVLAEQLDADLDIVLAHKMRTPSHPELAMGAVTETGKLIINQALVDDLGIRAADIEAEKLRQMAEMRRRSEMFRRVIDRLPLAGRLVIVTDDGVATGATTEAALWAVGQEKPERLVAALPLGPSDTIARLAGAVDEIVCLRSPQFFMAVGQFYQRFDPVEDEDVLEILKEESEKRRAERR